MFSPKDDNTSLRETSFLYLLITGDTWQLEITLQHRNVQSRLSTKIASQQSVLYINIFPHVFCIPSIPKRPTDKKHVYNPLNA